MGIFIDLTGKTFGRLTAIDHERITGKDGRSRVYWNCTCECGKTVSVESSNLTTGKQLSCGCLKKEQMRHMTVTHDKINTRLYGVWNTMKSRCYNKNVYWYKRYGGRGITVCDEWRNDYNAFYNWAIANGYDEAAPRGACTIDRIDYNGNYCPENCRIVSQKQQMQNVSTNHNLEYNGEVHCISEWSRITGISPFKIRNRINVLGWSPERALTTV